MKNRVGRLLAEVNAPVFLTSAGLILIIAILGASFPREAEGVFDALHAGIITNFGWLYVAAVALFLVFVAALAIGRYADVKLGPDDAEPDFSYGSWVAMLFSAGMGIGLMFFGVAEPIMHYASPPGMEGGTPAAASKAMEITFFHWGIHAWGIYAVVGLSLAYFGYRRGLPLTIRSSLYPILGDRIHGPAGHLVDILAVVSTLFGVATSLGFGVTQVNAGLTFLFDVPNTIASQLFLIATITALATASVVSGLDVGIRRLSEGNLIMAVALMIFVLVAGETVFLLKAFVQNIGAYASNIVHRSFNLFTYEPNDWIGAWTLFYWAWWIAWSPFVGMFIARISRGRTVREFITGVLFVPAAFTFFWMTVFGNSAIFFQSEGIAPIAELVAENMPVALFALLENFPFSAVASFIATLLAITFFVTSSDSGSLVIDIITSGGVEDPPVWSRVFWATTEGVVAAVLLLAGGLSALQAASITTALPFTVVLLLVCWGLYRGLESERARKTSHRVATAAASSGPHLPWQKRLGMLLTHPTGKQARAFLRDTAIPALEEVAREMTRRGLKAEVGEAADHAALTVRHNGSEEYPFEYAIWLKGYETPRFVFPEFDPKRRSAPRYYRAEVYQTEGGDSYDVLGYSKEQLITDVLSQYERHQYYMHIMA